MGRSVATSDTMQSIQIPIYWRGCIAEENGNGYSYPEKFTKFFRTKYSGPAVYRWRIHPAAPGRKEAVYIGEAENLVQRVLRVLTPPKAKGSGQTNQRLKKVFDEAVEGNKRVFLDFADFDRFEINGVLLSPAELDDKFKRCLMENLSLCTAERERFEILNKRLDPINKVLSRFKLLSPHAQRELLRQTKGN